MRPLFQTHLRAMQTAAGLCLGTAALIALPLLAADWAPAGTVFPDSYYADHIVKLFQKTGAAARGTFDNLSVGTSAFDLPAYVSHTCFRPTEYDIPRCKAEFGPYFNLKETYNSGMLGDIVRGVPYLAGVANLVPSPTNSVARAEQAIKPVIVQDSTRKRSVELWRICQEKTGYSRADASRCYQRNIRLTQDWSVMVEGNVY